MAAQRPALMSLLGVSGAGKTMLAEQLVGRWTRAGLAVGYAKHASHGFSMDRPGKDTDRVAAAGAAGVAVTGPGGTAFVERGEPESPESLVARFFPDHDIVVLEGFRTAGFPSVVIVGDAPPATAIAESRGPLLAVVAGSSGLDAARTAAGAAPVFARDDFDGLAAHLETALRLHIAVAGEPRRASEPRTDS
jgi:molybdopterin-guanine dinucleotide biosynthesis protein MobB